jgi:hypothetical protein
MELWMKKQISPIITAIKFLLILYFMYLIISRGKRKIEYQPERKATVTNTKKINSDFLLQFLSLSRIVKKNSAKQI